MEAAGVEAAGIEGSWIRRGPMLRLATSASSGSESLTPRRRAPSPRDCETVTARRADLLDDPRAGVVAEHARTARPVLPVREAESPQHFVVSDLGQEARSRDTRQRVARQIEPGERARPVLRG